jgi:hypothetical protein
VTVDSSALVLGPLLRHVDETSAAIWVETRDAGTVEVSAAGRTWNARTFGAHGHHYALVAVDGLEPGSIQDYTVSIGGEPVWPPDDSPYPPSRIATLRPGKELRLVFGSCRTSVTHDAAGNRSHGVDAMRAYALHMAKDRRSWPDLILFLGDQVYADETSDPMREFIKSRRDIEQPPGEELKDFTEYTYLYEIAWTDPANRWLLSTLPSAMIFDDHDIRDDWNTSASWRAAMKATDWWHDRIVGGLATYWIYQHLGNLSPSERAEDEVWRLIESAWADSDEEPDMGEVLDALGERADDHPETYRWSYARDIGSTRLIVIDSRAARVLNPQERSILDAEEMDWFDDQLQGGFNHLLIGTSLPFMLSPGLHQFEAWNEAVSTGAWGERWSRLGERIRQGVDLEHWAAFQEGFTAVAKSVIEVASGRRGTAPGTVTFLSGDVHNSYVAEVDRRYQSRIVQAVCSPIRNPLPYAVRYMTGFSSKNVGRGVGRFLARKANVPPAPFDWHTTRGPWFDNNLATLETDGRSLRMRWERGAVYGDKGGDPVLERVSEVEIRN